MNNPGKKLREVKKRLVKQMASQPDFNQMLFGVSVDEQVIKFWWLGKPHQVPSTVPTEFEGYRVVPQKIERPFP